MAETAKSDLITLGMATLVISLICNIMITTYFTTSDSGYYLKDTEFQNSYLVDFNNNVPTSTICAQGDNTCTSEIINTGTVDTSQYDIVPSLFNIGKLAKNIAEFMFMLPLFPAMLAKLLTVSTDAHGALITNTWLVTIVSIIASLWTFINVATIVKFIFRK